MIHVDEPKAAVATSTREDDEVRGFHQAALPQVELIHLPTFSAAGSIEKGSQTILSMPAQYSPEVPFEFSPV